ncbi:hypothetical protein D3C87_1898480 [compost metagenome]
MRQRQREPCLDLDRGSQRPAEQSAHAAHQFGQVHFLLLQLLLAGKGQHALRQLRPALRRLQRIVQ